MMIAKHISQITGYGGYISRSVHVAGSFYEKLVGTAKSAFKMAVGRRSLRREELETLLHEVEAVAGSRPLTFV